MSIWDAFGKGRYKGFSREAGQLLDKAVELAGGLGCKKADTGQLHRLVQQLPRLPGKALVPSFAECIPNAHLRGSYLLHGSCLLYCPVASKNSIAPPAGKKSEVCVTPAQKQNKKAI